MQLIHLVPTFLHEIITFRSFYNTKSNSEAGSEGRIVERHQRLCCLLL